MATCRLSGRLRVPEEYANREILEDFEYRVDTFDTQETEEQQWVHTYRQKGENLLFARGDMKKLLKHFGHLKWSDKRIFPPLGFPLRPRMRSLPGFDEERYKAQREALVQWLQWPHCSVVAQTGWGKTTYGILLASVLGLRTLVLTHRTPIRDEWLKRFKQETNIEEWERLTGKRLLGSIREGRLFPITIATYQTFLGTKKQKNRQRGRRLRKQACNYFGLCIGDEAHRVPALNYARIVLGMKAAFVTGITATPERRDHLESVLFDITGPFDIRGKGQQLNCEVDFVPTGVNVPWGIRSYNAMVNFLARSGRWNKIIAETVAKDVKKGHRRALVITIRVKHAHQLAKRLTKKGLRVEVVTGQFGNKGLAAQRLNDGQIDAIVSTNVFDEGVNIVNLDNIHLTIPSGNPVSLEQRTGRSRRTAEGKTRPSLVRDYLATGHPRLKRYLKERMERYRKLGYIINNPPPAHQATMSFAGFTKRQPKKLF